VRVPFRTGGFGATFPVAPGRVSGPVTPTPLGARGYGLGALGGVGCVECGYLNTGCLRFAPKVVIAPAGTTKLPPGGPARRAPRHSPHRSPEPGRQEFLKVHPALKGRGFQL